jgi:hypothetical protein
MDMKPSVEKVNAVEPPSPFLDVFAPVGGFFQDDDVDGGDDFPLVGIQYLDHRTIPFLVSLTF